MSIIYCLFELFNLKNIDFKRGLETSENVGFFTIFRPCSVAARRGKKFCTFEQGLVRNQKYSWTFDEKNHLQIARLFPPKGYIFDSKPDTILTLRPFFSGIIFPPKGWIFLDFFLDPFKKRFLGRFKSVQLFRQTTYFLPTYFWSLSKA